MKNFLKRWRLRRCGRRAMWRYIAAVEEIAGQFNAAACRFAEEVCPGLRRKRRRGKACAKLLTQLSA